MLADVYLAEYRMGFNPRPNPLERAFDMALKAVELDPRNAFAHCWPALTYFFRGQIGRFEAEADRALQLNPNDPEILADFGHYFSYMDNYCRGNRIDPPRDELRKWNMRGAVLDHFLEGLVRAGLELPAKP